MNKRPTYMGRVLVNGTMDGHANSDANQGTRLTERWCTREYNHGNRITVTVFSHTPSIIVKFCPWHLLCDSILLDGGAMPEGRRRPVCPQAVMGIQRGLDLCPRDRRRSFASVLFGQDHPLGQVGLEAVRPVGVRVDHLYSGTDKCRLVFPKHKMSIARLQTRPDLT